MAFFFDFKDKYLKINCIVLAIFVKTIRSYLDQIEHYFSDTEKLQTDDHNIEKFYEDCEYIGREIIKNRDRCTNCLLIIVKNIINGTLLTKYGGRSSALSKIIKKMIKDLENKRLTILNDPAGNLADCINFTNVSFESAKKIALEFVDGLLYNDPPNLGGEISIVKNNYPFAIAIPDGANTFPNTSYTIKLNIINNSFQKTPFSHFMALEIILLHELLAHSYSFPTEIKYFSEGVMRFMPYKYYRVNFRSEYAVWNSFNRINKIHFLNLKNNPAYHGYKFAQELCEEFANVDYFFELIGLMTFESFQHIKFSKTEDYDDHLLRALRELRRVYYLKKDIGGIEAAILNSNNINELVKLLRKL